MLSVRLSLWIIYKWQYLRAGGDVLPILYMCKQNNESILRYMGKQRCKLCTIVYLGGIY